MYVLTPEAFIKSQMSANNTAINTLKKRREQVQNVIDSLNTAFSDNVEDVNKKITSSVNALSSGIVGIAQVNSTASSLAGKKEKYSDGSLTSSKDQLVAERRRINDRISDLERENSRYRTQLENLQD